MLLSGYMAPEYAIDGLFSVKSDVFSFGILVLETVSGKRNRGLYHSNQSLVGHVSNLFYIIFVILSSFMVQWSSWNCSFFRCGSRTKQASLLNWSTHAWQTHPIYLKCYDVFILVSYVCKNILRIGLACHLLWQCWVATTRWQCLNNQVSSWRGIRTEEIPRLVLTHLLSMKSLLHF